MRRSTLSTNKVSIGIIAVILIVILRIAIGWHYFYEGLHKMHPRADFTAKGFLGQAKGPTADLYYAMLPDLLGEKRLRIAPKEDVEDFEYTEYIEKVETSGDFMGSNTVESKKVVVKNLPTFPVYEKAWSEFRDRYKTKVKLDEEDIKRVDSIYGHYITALREYAAEVEEDVDGYRRSLERFREEKRQKTNDTPHQRERNWDKEMGYRAEAELWMNELDNMGVGLQSALGYVFSPELSGTPSKLITDPEKAIIPNPVVDSQMRLLDLSVTYGLTAIGLCMILGFCNRLASLGAAVFLTNVVLSQFPWPGIYPPTPSMIGNFLFVNKDLVELIACLVLASLPAGRWGGLDFFLWNCGGKKIAKAYGFKG